jgi:predicted flap endonuclease-1-like 5' DNA nuclease
VWVFLALVGLAVAFAGGWLVRNRVELVSDQDPQLELKMLREAHSGCATKIRTLNLEVAQLESRLAMNQSQSTMRADTHKVSDEELAGAAHLASLLEVFQPNDDIIDAAPQPDGSFMSILPEDVADEQTPRVVDPDGIVVSLIDKEAEPEAAEPDVSRIEVDLTGVDDLTLIKGIGPKIAALLNEHGITRFAQIAELDEDTIDSLGDALGSFRGRIRRDDWVGSARRLVGEFVAR